MLSFSLSAAPTTTEREGEGQYCTIGGISEVVEKKETTVNGAASIASSSSHAADISSQTADISSSHAAVNSEGKPSSVYAEFCVMLSANFYRRHSECFEGASVVVYSSAGYEMKF